MYAKNKYFLVSFWVIL